MKVTGMKYVVYFQDAVRLDTLILKMNPLMSEVYQQYTVSNNLRHMTNVSFNTQSFELNCTAKGFY